MLKLTTYTELEIAHRLSGAYSGRCLHWHGHRYEVEITVTAQKLNEDGMIVDFKKLKEVVKTVLDDKWDHGACVRADDPLARSLMEDAHHERVHVIQANPTLEWMVGEWANLLQWRMDQEGLGIIVTELKASETARNTVTWTRDSMANGATVDPNASAKAAATIGRIAQKQWDEHSYKGRICSASEKKALEVPDAQSNIPEACRNVAKELGITLPVEAPEGESWEDSPDAVPYLVTYTNCHSIGSTVLSTPLKGRELYDFCTGAIQPLNGLGDKLIVIAISRLPQ